MPALAYYTQIDIIKYLHLDINRMSRPTPKPLDWVGSSKKDLMSLPSDVKDVFGYALHLAQSGLKHPDAKPLTGFGGAGVLEVVDDFDGDTYRAVYTVKFKDMVYVLHCFQKKSRKGAETPKEDMDLIKSRLKYVEELLKKR
jgi:phage-related protein